MAWRCAITAVLAAVLLTGCKETPAFFLYAPAAAKPAIADASLTGRWRIEPLPDPAPEGPAAEQPDTAPSASDAPAPRIRPEATLRVELQGEIYAITMTRGRRTESFTARLFELEGVRYFAAQLIDRYVTADSAQYYRAPVAIFRVVPGESELASPFNLSFLKQSWVDKRRNEGSLATAHTKIDDVPVIVAEPVDAAAFLAAAAGTPEAWQPLGAALTPLGD